MSYVGNEVYSGSRDVKQPGCLKCDYVGTEVRVCRSKEREV